MQEVSEIQINNDECDEKILCDDPKTMGESSKDAALQVVYTTCQYTFSFIYIAKPTVLGKSIKSLQKIIAVDNEEWKVELEKQKSTNKDIKNVLQQ